MPKVCREVLALLLMAKDLRESFLGTCVEKSHPEHTDEFGWLHRYRVLI